MRSSYAKAPGAAPSPRNKLRGRIVVRAFVAFILTAAVGVSGPAAAQAVISYEPATGSPFGTDTSSSIPGAIAVNETTDDVFLAISLVGSGSPGPIERHAAAGAFETSFGSGFWGGVAIDQATQTVYAFDGMSEIKRLDSDGASAGTPIAVTADLSDGIPDIHNSLAVDGSGNVYYPNQLTDTVQKFAPAGGAPLLEISGGFVNPTGVAVDSAGNVYVVDKVGNGSATNGRLQKFDSTGAAATCPPSICQSGLVLNVALDPATDNVFVSKTISGGTNSDVHVVAYDSAGNEIDTFGAGLLGSSVFSFTNIAVNSGTGRVYVVNPDTSSPGVAMFDPVEAFPPIVDATDATNVGSDSATLNGTVDPEGVEISDCTFEYVDGAEFDLNGFTNATTTPCNPASPGSGTSPVAVTADITGLSGVTEYHVRLSAASTDGSDQDEVTFTTLAQCGDGMDNDSDGQIDFPGDSGCASAADNSESPMQDDDGDGAPNVNDNCPAAPNGDQANTDGANDGGDACDVDDDNDGMADGSDNCPTAANADQSNTDGDALGNACDSPTNGPDSDGDGVFDITDQCDTASGPSSNSGCPVVLPKQGALALASKSAAYKRGKASIKVKCSGGPCNAGKVTLKAKIKSSSKKAKTVTIGSASIKAMAGGATATIKVKLNRKAKSALGKAGKLKATASGRIKGTITIRGGKK